ncbi:MAG: hypothetical protein P8X79_05615 [Reinekea sp.]
MIDDDDFKAFQDEMKGVKPIRKKDKVDLQKHSVAEPSLIHRRQMAVKVETGHNNTPGSFSVYSGLPSLRYSLRYYSAW